MTWRLIPLIDIPPTPWKNGGGVTRELIAWPDAAAWVWRISVAEVASNGLFSRFEGVRRWLAILRGVGVRLSFNDRTHELTAKGEPMAFEGSDAVECALIRGAVRDLNLMVKSSAEAPRGSRMLRVSGCLRELLEHASVVAVFSPAELTTISIDGVVVKLPPATLGWRRVAAGSLIEVEAADALWMALDATGMDIAV